MKKQFSKLIIHLIIYIGGFIWFYPYLWTIFSSFKESSKILTGVFNSKVSFDNYNFILDSAKLIEKPFVKAFFISLISAIIIIFFTLLSSVFTAFVLTKLNLKGREKVEKFIIFQVVFPNFMFFLPLFIIVNQFKLVNTYISIVLPYLMSAWAVFMMTQSFKSTPNDYLEAAKIDGANIFSMIFHVMIPLNKSIIAIVGLFTFISAWDNFMWPLIVIKSFDKMPLAVLLATLAKQYVAYLGPVFAGATIQTLPSLVLFIIFKKYFLEGISVSLK